MSQQINLYPVDFRPEKKQFSSAAMLQALVLVLVGLTTFYVYARFQVTTLARQANALDQQVRAGLERVKKIPGAPSAAEEKQADARIAELDARLKASEQLLAQPGMSRAGTSYTEPLKALARQRVDGVWLTSIALTGDAGELSLNGRALRAELVPQYIDRLSRDPAMRARRFATLAIERDAAAKSTDAKPAQVPESVSFRLSAGAEEK